ncbi:unnamed protein product [Commensalibacter communis]|uniref:hypothetical protein n=1 Tax=Commensalibacter communis TaxID=2972786 RepID=UPI0022FF7C5D|nr:hypothetical protein [Commensalibacter communis]CAI3947660.1 unnamed protein product [Commensalibacter communis]
MSKNKVNIKGQNVEVYTGFDNDMDVITKKMSEIVEKLLCVEANKGINFLVLWSLLFAILKHKFEMASLFNSMLFGSFSPRKGGKND